MRSSSCHLGLLLIFLQGYFSLELLDPSHHARVRALLVLPAHKYFQCWVAFLHFFSFYLSNYTYSSIVAQKLPPTSGLPLTPSDLMAPSTTPTLYVGWTSRCHLFLFFLVYCLQLYFHWGIKAPGAKSASCSPLDLSLFPAQCTADYIHPIKNTLNKAWNVNNPNNNIVPKVYRFGEIESLLHFWWQCKIVHPLWKIVGQFLINLNRQLPYDPTFIVLGI